MIIILKIVKRQTYNAKMIKALRLSSKYVRSLQNIVKGMCEYMFHTIKDV